MIRFKMSENDLKDLFEKARMFSDNFTNLSEMLIEFPRGLLIIRIASGFGQPKFSKVVGIEEGNLWLVENGKVGLGKLNTSRIEDFLKSFNLNFSWANIKNSFERLDSLSIGARFDKLSFEELRKISIKGLKSKKPDESEKIIMEALNELNIPFEFQAPLLAFENTKKLQIIDFAIPNGDKPKVLIEVTSGRLEKNIGGHFLINSGNEKLIAGLRIKHFLPKVNLLLFVTGKIDEFSKTLLSESFDKIFLKSEIRNMKNTLKVILNDRSN